MPFAEARRSATTFRPRGARRMCARGRPFSIRVSQGITMAGKMQLVAKLLLGTAVLATGGSGVYYASTHGWSLHALSRGTTQSTPSELDAVASAWADAASTQAGAKLDAKK